MGKVRKFETSDIGEIIGLNARMFPGSASLTREIQEGLFREVCFGNPWLDPEISSLVHVEPDGRISGFLGIVPRQMSFKGKKIRVAVGQHLMADRSTLASVQLFRSFIAGPQDLSVTDMAIDLAKNIWERLNGSAVTAHSIYWRRVLRPSRFALSYLTKEKILPGFAKSTAPVWGIADWVLNKIPKSPARFPETGNAAEELSEKTFLENLGRYAGSYDLTPVYTQESVAWLFRMLGKEKRYGDFQRIVLNDTGGEPIGWYLYNLKPGGRSEVLQIAGEKRHMKTILGHLFHHAWSRGSLELCGRVDPRFMREYAENYCLFMPGRNWMLVHSRDPEISNSIHRGEAFLSRLEGDLWFF